MTLPSGVAGDKRIVVITGATGFLGRHVVPRVANADVDVLAVSRRSVRGMRQVRDYAECPPGDVVIHLGEEPDRTRFNCLGEAAVRESAAIVTALVSRFGDRVIYASSAVVYGDEHSRACPVNTPVQATDDYSRSKLLNERIVLDAGGLVVRLSNLFGHGMSASTVLPDILRQIPGSGPVHVRDDTPIRDFLSVSDAASAIAMAVKKPFSGVMNVGSGVGTSIGTLVRLALVAAGQDDREIVPTAPSLRPSMNVLDISETTERIGWSPTSPLSEQLGRLFQHTIASRA
jgi:UDP-glucose 4-epimerase